MQSKLNVSWRKAKRTPPARHPGSDPNRTPRVVAAIGAVLMTALGMTMLVSNAPAEPTPLAATGGVTGYINGIPVFDLPGITVTPETASGRNATATARVHGYGNGLLQRLGGSADAATTSLGAHLSMPYYSFGQQLGRISKD